MEHKAQVFSHEKGDHYRTRLTHTIEVAQIARSISRNLGLNEDLTEAIAMGHDVGHTPFGHQGERTLNLIMSGKETLNGKIKLAMDHGGFKHNFQSIKVLDQIERIYDGEDYGLFLTWQTIDGILKHTKIADESGKLLCNAKNFANHYDFYFYDKDICLLDYSYPITLEGQVVALADEIAQRQHDLDDALEDKSLGVTIDGIISEIKNTVENMQSSSNPKTNSEIIDMAGTFLKRLDDINQRKDSNQKRRSLVSAIIEYFVIDATYQSMENLLARRGENQFEFKGSICFKNKLITQSKIGGEIDRYLESFINATIINSYEVNRFDGRAVYIIKQLFKAYYHNPRQMSNPALNQISTNLSKICNQYKIDDIIISNMLNVNLRTGGRGEVSRLIDFMHTEITTEFPVFKGIYNEGIKGLYSNMSVDNNKAFYDKLKEYSSGIAKSSFAEEMSVEEKIARMLIDANYYFLSSICDYIAGMTDNYALEEFKKLYAIKTV